MQNSNANGFINVWVLTLSNALAASIMALMILVGSLVGSDLAPAAEWATLPLALTICGTAAGIVPATQSDAALWAANGDSGLLWGSASSPAQWPAWPWSNVALASFAWLPCCSAPPTPHCSRCALPQWSL